MKSEIITRTARVIRVIDHGTNIQLLCADERGLLSVYFECKPFIFFRKLVQKTGKTLIGLVIEFNNDMVRMVTPGNDFKFYPTREKS